MRSDRGAAAVEMALLAMPLVLLLMGILDFGRLLYTQNTITHAAQEGARYASLGKPDVVAKTQAAAGGLVVAVNPGAVCTSGSDATVTVTYSFKFVSPLLFGVTNPRNLNAKGVEQCWN